MAEIEKYQFSEKDKKTRGQEFFENLTNPQNNKGVWIDNGMTELVRTVNSETSLDTRECCSNLFRDHYYMEDMKRELSFNEFINGSLRNFGNNYTPMVSTDSFLHKFKDDGTVVLEKPDSYHNKLKQTRTEPIDVDNYESRVEEAESWEEMMNIRHEGISVGWRVDFVPSIRAYLFSVDAWSNYIVFNYADSYEERDEIMQSAIDSLSGSIVEVSPRG